MLGFFVLNGSADGWGHVVAGSPASGPNVFPTAKCPAIGGAFLFFLFWKFNVNAHR
jgi:hypothetical protein